MSKVRSSLSQVEEDADEPPRSALRRVWSRRWALWRLASSSPQSTSIASVRRNLANQPNLCLLRTNVNTHCSANTVPLCDWVRDQCCMFWGVGSTRNGREHACIWSSVSNRPALPGLIGSSQLADTQGMPVRKQLWAVAATFGLFAICRRDRCNL